MVVGVNFWGELAGCSPRRASPFLLARKKEPKTRLNSGAHDRTHFAPEALRSDNYRESEQKLGRGLLHSAMQQRGASIATEMGLVVARVESTLTSNSSQCLCTGISRRREMQHEQREVP